MELASRSSIRGWGADLEDEDRPASNREANEESVTDIDGDKEYQLIPRQRQTVEVLVSTEHKTLPPIFATTCPPSGLSGVIRRAAFRFSEGQKLHWLLLLFADRVNVWEELAKDMAKGNGYHPFKEMGLKAEFKRGGFFTRFGRNRADVRRWRQQAVLLGVFGAATFIAVKKFRNRKDAA